MLHTERRNLDSGFVPKPLVDETLEQFSTPFHHKALYASIVEVVEYLGDAFLRVDDGWRATVLQMKRLWQTVMSVDGKAQRIRPLPISCSEGRVVSMGCPGTDKDGLVPGTKTMNKGLCQGIRKENRSLSLPLGKGWGEATVLALCPFKGNPRTVLLMESEEKLPGQKPRKSVTPEVPS